MKRAAILVVLAATCLGLSGCEDKFRTMCESELGGVVKTDTKFIQTTAFDSKGRAIFGTSTVTVKFCLKDGQIVAQG